MIRFKKTIFLLLGISFCSPSGTRANGLSELSGHVPSRSISKATHLGRKSSTDRMQLAISLKLPNPNDLSNFLKQLYDPKDPHYHQFLSTESFVNQFAPTQQDVDLVTAYLNDQGLKVTSIHPNHLIVDVEGTVSTVENAFQIEMHEYLTRDGRIAYAPTTDPIVSDPISSKLTSIVGLHNFSVRKHALHKSTRSVSPNPATSGGIGNYMTPAKIKSGYNLNSLTQTGSGETIALYELDGYTPSDISAYTSYFSITPPTLTNVLVDGATGSAGSGADEVTIDIELVMALAPGVSKILVYEAPNSSTTSQEELDVYSRIASDNLANEVSTSWVIGENQMTPREMNAENTVFQEMAAHGQSIFAAAGDYGAYGDSENGTSSLVVDDPASQPYVTGVGGTLLTLSGSNTWSSETSWYVIPSPTPPYSSSNTTVGGGGGISSLWSIPSWQSGLSTIANKGSSSKRMVPDVSLESDPNNGYPVYYAAGGGWVLYGGTSCAAPLWAAFTALVNQKLVASGQSRLGFANPSLYGTIGKSTYSSSFHDIADGSTNLYYPATTGYDLTTGLGSFNGSGLFSALTAIDTAPSTPGPVTLIPGSLSITVSWPALASASTYTVLRSTSAGGTYASVASVSATSYTDSGVSYGSTYYYKVTATNTYGTSSASSVVSGAPYPAPPGAPASLTVEIAE